MERRYKAKNNFLIIKEYKTEVDSLNYGEEIEINKQKFIEGVVVDIGKNVDKEEFYLGMIVRCAEFVAGHCGEDFYHVQVDDIACQILLGDEDNERL